MVMNSSYMFQIITPYFWEIINKLIFPILVLIIVHYYKNNNKGNKWLAFLRNNAKIDECLDDYAKVKYSDFFQFGVFGLVRNVLFAIIGFFLTIYIYGNYFFDPNNIMNSLFTMAIDINTTIIAILFFIGFYTISLIKENKVLEKSNLIESINKIVISFFFGSSFSFAMIFIIILIIPNGIPNGFSREIPKLVFTVFFISMVLIFYKMIRYVFLDILKTELRLKYIKYFPYVNISTNAGNVYGKIDTIFNDKMIRLDNEGTKIAIEWEKIIFIELFKSP